MTVDRLKPLKPTSSLQPSKGGRERARHDADLELVRGAQNGDPAAVSELLERTKCVRGMLVFQNRRLRGRLGEEELEDLVQSTLLAIWRKLDDYAGIGKLESWLFRFCYLETLARLREMRRLPRQLDDSVDPPQPERDPASEALDHEHLYRVLDRLDAPVRRILLLKHVEELTFDQIGKRLDLSANTAKTRYYRGIAKLRGLLASQMDGPARGGDA